MLPFEVPVRREHPKERTETREPHMFHFEFFWQPEGSWKAVQCVYIHIYIYMYVYTGAQK